MITGREELPFKSLYLQETLRILNVQLLGLDSETIGAYFIILPETVFLFSISLWGTFHK